MALTALVVDDDEALRTYTREAVAECGFQVIEAESADEAVGLLEGCNGGVALVVTDVQMPGRLDGTRLAQMIIERWPGVRVLVTSGQNIAKLPPKVAFMRKPWLPLDLINFALDARPAV